MSNQIQSNKVISLEYVPKPFLERNDSLVRYYSDIRDYKPIKDEEIKALLEERINATPERKKEIEEYIFNHNARLVISLARKYCTQKDNLDDLIEEGNIGLLIAIEKYDPAKVKKSTFVSFALFYIRREINAYKTNHTDMVYRTNHARTEQFARTMTCAFMQKHDRMPTTQELMTMYNSNQANKNRRVGDHTDFVDVEYVYIDNLEQIDGNFTDCQSYIDYTSHSATSNDYCKEMADSHNKSYLSALMSCLSEKEKKAISLMYGIETNFEESLSSIATKLGVTSERARQLCSSALEKLQARVAAR